MTAMGAEESSDTREVPQATSVRALVPAAFLSSPRPAGFPRLRMPQRARLSVLNQLHEGLQGSQTSGATAPTGVCPQSRGTRDHTDPAVPPVHVRALVPNPIWALLGPWHRPGRVASLFLLTAFSHFPFPADAQRRPHNTFSGWKSTASLPGFLCADGASWAEGWEEGVSLWAPGMSSPPSPLCFPFLHFLYPEQGERGSQALFQKAYFYAPFGLLQEVLWEAG